MLVLDSPDGNEVLVFSQIQLCRKAVNKMQENEIETNFLTGKVEGGRPTTHFDGVIFQVVLSINIERSHIIAQLI